MSLEEEEKVGEALNNEESQKLLHRESKRKKLSAKRKASNK